MKYLFDAKRPGFTDKTAQIVFDDKIEYILHTARSLKTQISQCMEKLIPQKTRLSQTRFTLNKIKKLLHLIS